MKTEIEVSDAQAAWDASVAPEAVPPVTVATEPTAVAVEPITAVRDAVATDPGLAEPAPENQPVVVESEPVVESAAVAPAVTDTEADEPDEQIETPAVANWMPLLDIIKTEQFQSLDTLSKSLMVGYWKTGGRIKAVKLILSESGIDEASQDVIARTVAERFDRGSLSELVDIMTGVSAKDRFLKSLSRAVKSRRTTKAQISALNLNAQILGLLPTEKESL
jgi:hypothetical protein